jgi:antirestriction protein ArdC
MLWASAVEQSFAAPIWMTFKQAVALKSIVRKGEKGTLVYANSVTRTEHGDATGQDVAREIAFLKGHTVFNAEQIDGLPEVYYAKVQPLLDGFYATLAHETTHWTKHPSRLQRDFGRRSWGDEANAREELVAELGAAFLCADLELTPEVREDHASYISSWLDALHNDKRCIVQAATHAQRAVDYLHGLQPQPLPGRREGGKFCWPGLNTHDRGLRCANAACRCRVSTQFVRFVIKVKPPLKN